MMFKERLQKCLGDNLRQIPLFGSRARGERTESSDLDVAVIVKRDDGTIRRTVYDEAADLSMAMEILLSPFVISKERFNWYVSIGRRIACEIEQEGIAI